MNSYTFIYLFCIVSSIILWGLIFRVNRGYSGFFFFLFTIFASIWYGLYYVFFLWGDSYDLLLVSRGAFASGILSVYSLLFSLKYFQPEEKYSIHTQLYYIGLFYVWITALYIGTPWMIAGLEYDTSQDAYREVYGNYYILTLFFYVLFLGWFSLYAYKNLQQKTWLSRLRIRGIIIGTCIFLFTLIFLQVILPYYNIWILEKEIIFLFLFFVIFIYYNFRRYYFTSLGYSIGKTLITLSSLVLSIIWGLIGEYVFKTASEGHGYWQWQDNTHIILIVLAIAFFSWIHRLLSHIFLGNTRLKELKENIQDISRMGAAINDVTGVSAFLAREFKRIFRSKSAEIHLLWDYPSFPEMEKFFTQNPGEGFLIHDIVFLDLQKDNINIKHIADEIPKNIFLIFPLYNSEECLQWFFFLGHKPFSEFYNEEEIKLLKEFSFFLGLRIQSIHMYQKISDLSLNLDAKVDEKTLEYNDLINRQKEFIGMISHEIKTPIASAIFQADSIVDDVQNGKVEHVYLIQEARILQEQLTKIGDLISKLFSVQYYDTRSVTLFREHIDIVGLLRQEIELYRKIYPHVIFVENIDPDIGYIDLDRIQFQQILTNIISNACKQFQNTRIPTICVWAWKVDGYFFLDIEDNGSGFKGIDVECIFDRYSTGGGWSAGLGLGLYLCKMIVEMHGGTITASISKNLGWAHFHIMIPIS